MELKLLILAALTTLAGSVHAQDVYGGLGLPGLVSLGYAQPINTNWGWRGEYARGLSINKDGVQDGVNVTGTFNTEVSTSLVNSGLVTQADVDAQTKTMRDSVSGLSVLPSFSVGMTYRF